MTPTEKTAVTRAALDAFTDTLQRKMPSDISVGEMQQMFLGASIALLGSTVETGFMCCLPDKRRLWLEHAAEVLSETFDEAGKDYGLRVVVTVVGA